MTTCVKRSMCNRQGHRTSKCHCSRANWLTCFAQITGGAARAIDIENGFEIWRRLHNQFSPPERARATSLLNEIIGLLLRNDHLESDLCEFMILKNRHGKTTGRPLDEDLCRIRWAHCSSTFV